MFLKSTGSCSSFVRLLLVLGCQTVVFLCSELPLHVCCLPFFKENFKSIKIQQRCPRYAKVQNKGTVVKVSIFCIANTNWQLINKVSIIVSML